jgi:HNH endonuclease
MKLIKDLGIKAATNRNYRYGLFKCPCCKKKVEKIMKDGIVADYCSHKCYASRRIKRGNYKSHIMSNKYRYIYKPDHPVAIGTKKLYVAEHRLVMEAHLGRFLTRDEVVHHKDENTLNNELSNLQLMTPSEHSSYHSQKRAKHKNGKFKT